MKNENWMILGPVCLANGLIVACLAFQFYRFALFMAGIIGGAVFGRLLFQILDAHHNQITFIPEQWWTNYHQYVLIETAILVGVIFGILALKFVDCALKVLTAYIGSFILTASIAYFIEPYTKQRMFISLTSFFGQLQHGDINSFKPELNQWTLISLVTWILLFIIGVQYRYPAKDKIEDNDYKYELHLA